MIGLRPDDFWSLGVSEWFAVVDGWAKQYPEGEGSGNGVKPLDRSEYEELWASARETQRKAGIIH